MNPPNTILTTAEKNACEYGGGFGVALTLTCLIQHLIFAIPGPVTNPMIPAYIFSAIAFLLFALQKHFSVILLVISGVFALIIEYLWVSHYAFSVVVMLLVIYHLTFVPIVFALNIPSKLKLKRASEKAEKDMWAGKI